MISAQGWGWRYAGRDTPAVQGLDFEIGQGERVLLLGASGSGKSTVLAGLAGILGGPGEGTELGRLLLAGRHPTRIRGQVGLVMQDPESQVVLAKVGDDVAFGMENLGVPRARIWPRVTAALADAGLDLPLGHPTGALSGGQQQRLAIAAALAMQGGTGPAVLCLDEPTANLDPAGIAEVREAIGRVVSDRRVTLLVVEHRVDIWANLVDRIIVLSPDGVLADGPVGRVLTERAAELLAAGIWVPGTPLGVRPRIPPANPDAVLWGERLTTGHLPGHPVGSGLDVELPAGVSTVLTGPNGVGKSTLALTMAGLLRPLAGSVRAAPRLRPARRRKPAPADPQAWTSRELLTRIGTVFQQPERQFVESSVRDELAVGLRALHWRPPQITRRTDELLATLHLTHLAGVNPFTLSGGEQRRLSVGTVLATSPEVIFLDEPTFGQDRNTWLDLVGLVGQILAEGRTIVSVTHDPNYLTVLGEHRIGLVGHHG